VQVAGGRTALWSSRADNRVPCRTRVQPWVSGSTVGSWL
jgi:hypothetical protein